MNAVFAYEPLSALIDMRTISSGINTLRLFRFTPQTSESQMKKSLASILCVTYLAFGIPAHAAEENYSAPIATHVAEHDSAKSQKKVQRAADRALAKQVRTALTKTKGLQTVNITVLARHGVISLSGHVPDTEQVQLAGNTATQIAGVTSVTNNLVPGEAGH